MTAVEWLINELQLYYEGKSKLVYYEIIEQAKEMEKQQMHKCASFWRGKENKIEIPIFEQYYNETYGSKGSDVPQLKYKDGTPIRSYDSPKIQEMVKLMNEPTSSQTEISDEEIEKEASRIHGVGSMLWEEGAKWYREQLKSKICQK